MKYYLDTEFIEGPQGIDFMGFSIGKAKPTIDLISLGLVAENGKYLYLLSKDFNLGKAWDSFDVKADGSKVYWIRENVLLKIWGEHIRGDERNMIPFDKAGMRYVLDRYGFTNTEIAQMVVDFVGWCHTDTDKDGGCSLCVNMGGCQNNPKFYAYYSAYDWVVFCQLFGRMIDLPKNFPMYCVDLKQMMDEVAVNYFKGNSLQSKLKAMKEHLDYPTQSDAHNALDDARWNKKLHEFLIKISKK